MKLYHSKLLNDFCIKRSFDELIYSIPDSQVKESVEQFEQFKPKHVFTHKCFPTTTLIMVKFN